MDKIVHLISKQLNYFKRKIGSLNRIQKKIPSSIQNTIFYGVLIFTITSILLFFVFKMTIYFKKNTQTPYEFLQNNFFFKRQYIHKQKQKKAIFKKDVPLPILDQNKKEYLTRAQISNIKPNQSNTTFDSHFISPETKIEDLLPSKKIYSTPNIHIAKIKSFQKKITTKLTPNKKFDGKFQKMSKQPIKLLPVP